MAKVLDEQYCPIADKEFDGSSVNPPLSVRFVQHLARGINNAKAYANVHKLLTGPIPELLPSGDADYQTETISRVFVPRPCSPGYDRIRWSIVGKRTLGTTTAKVTWKLYCGSQIYLGPATFDATYLGARYTVDSLDIDSDSWEVQTSDSLDLLVPDDRNVYLTLTYYRDGPSDGNKGSASLSTLDAWARYGTSS
jgi:hypothetical protein